VKVVRARSTSVAKAAGAVLLSCVIGTTGAALLQVQTATARSPEPQAPQAAPASPLPAAAQAEAASSQRQLLDKYCVACHNARARTADLLLDEANVERLGENPALWEKVIRRLRADAMPPPGRPKPDQATKTAFVSWLESGLDKAAALHPVAGRAPIHRLNRTEYVNAIRDLFDIEIDGRALLPGDSSDRHGFDNIADVLSISPALMDRYLSAARKISRLAVGRPAGPDFELHAINKNLSQDDRMSEDLPFGSRGGAAVPYYFPTDGEYVFTVKLQRTGYDYIRGLGAEHEMDVRLDGAPLKRFTFGDEKWSKLAPPAAYSGNIYGTPEWEAYTHEADDEFQVHATVKAGRHVVGVSFVEETWEPEGVIQPKAVGVAWTWDELTLGNPALGSVTISGPVVAGPAQESPSRRKIFICRPNESGGEEACARRILSNLARRAYRRPSNDRDVQTLMTFYNAGRAEGGFDEGIQAALERLLVGPEFLLRIEADASAPGAAKPIGDLELASRLSFFLWSSIPDEELLEVATRKNLRDPATLERQVRRMLADPRSRALVDNFVGQWLVVRNIRDFTPDSDLFPDFDENLRDAFQRETEFFMEDQIREDRSVADALNANYTFLNERLARHYEIPGVYGNQFRKVTLTDDRRMGLLGQGSILAVTSYPNRTSPVLRGKWLLENFLGTPPSPPPNIPSLKENAPNGKPATVRARLEEHRRNAVCATCHAPMDPLGFALENFDPIGAWRTVDSRMPIDASGLLPDGTSFQGPAGLRNVMLSRREQFVRTVTEKLLLYALGREIEYYDEPVVRRITREAAPSGYRWSSLILGIVRSFPFQMRGSES